jgi:glycosyltransferase involved in cell wall biosynthesis
MFDFALLHEKRVVGNVIADSVHARQHARVRRPPSGVTVLYTDRFVDRKGIKEVLNAAPNFLGAEPHVRLVMAGGHRHVKANELATYWLPSRCESVRNRILFTGWQTSEQSDSVVAGIPRSGEFCCKALDPRLGLTMLLCGRSVLVG